MSIFWSYIHRSLQTPAMSTKAQSTGPNSTTTGPVKQARSRRAANPADTSIGGRAGSAGGVVLEKEGPKKLSTPTPAPPSNAAPSQSKDTSSAQPKSEAPKRKPRKLNKEPTPASAAAAAAAGKEGFSNEAAELEALKSRVRGLEAKVEELYKTTPTSSGAAAPRSPRRRGKGRKTSSAATTATLGNLAAGKKEKDGATAVEDDDEADADEELDRLESELEVARQDLALYNPQASQSRPRTRRSASEETEYVEEIPRERPGVSVGSDRQVTLSGSYRIPLPATLNPEDVKTIQSGVTAAQNVARSFLDQRRANQALRNAQADAGPPPAPNSSARAKAKAKTTSSSAQEQGLSEFGAQEAAGGKQSWGEWIGGYSMAISRAVKSIEHEAAMEAQQRAGQTRMSSGGQRAGAGTGGAARKKRPVPKTTLSGEQVEGLMS